MTLQSELVELEEGFWNATQDPEYYREHMADEGLAVFSMGIMDKDAAVESITTPGSGRWSHVQIEDARLVDLGEAGAALVYRGSAQRDGEPYVANCTTVYVRRDGGWQMALHQQSAIGAERRGS